MPITIIRCKLSLFPILFISLFCLLHSPFNFVALCSPYVFFSTYSLSYISTSFTLSLLSPITWYKNTFRFFPSSLPHFLFLFVTPHTHTLYTIIHTHTHIHTKRIRCGDESMGCTSDSKKNSRNLQDPGQTRCYRHTDARKVSMQKLKIDNKESDILYRKRWMDRQTDR